MNKLLCCRRGVNGCIIALLLPLSVTSAAIEHKTALSIGGVNYPGDPVILANLAHAFDLKQMVTLDPDAISAQSWFAGKRLGLTTATSAEFFWFQFARFHGINPETVQVSHYGADALPRALLDGEVDMAAMWEPWITTTAEQAGDRLRLLEHGNIHVAKWVLVTRRSMPAPEHLRAVLSAYRNAVDFIERDSTPVADAYYPSTSADVGIERARIDGQNYVLNLDWSLVVAVQQEFAWARNAGYTTSDEPAPVMQLMATEPLRNLLPSAVVIPGSAGEAIGVPPL